MANFNGGGQVVFSFNDKDFAKIKKMIGDVSPQKRDGVIERGIRKVTLEAEAILKTRILRGQVLNVRSGRLRTSIGSVVIRKGKDIVGTVGSGVRSGRRVPYANIHETGGVIKPKPGNRTGRLWIPVRKGSAYAIESGLSTKAVAFSSQVLRYIPVKSVTIPARKYMSKTVDQVDRVAVSIMLKEIDAELKKA